MKKIIKNRAVIIILTILSTLLVLAVTGNLTQKGHGVKYWYELEQEMVGPLFKEKECHFANIYLILTETDTLTLKDLNKIWKDCEPEWELHAK